MSNVVVELWNENAYQIREDPDPLKEKFANWQISKNSSPCPYFLQQFEHMWKYI